MIKNEDNDTQEIRDLRKQIESFQSEKERVRAIIGQIGGVPTVSTRIFNTIFVIFITICFVVSICTKGHISMLMIDIGLAALAGKLIYLMHYMSRVNHFQLWILSSIEWRLNELILSYKKKSEK